MRLYVDEEDNHTKRKARTLILTNYKINHMKSLFICLKKYEINIKRNETLQVSRIVLLCFYLLFLMIYAFRINAKSTKLNLLSILMSTSTSISTQHNATQCNTILLRRIDFKHEVNFFLRKAQFGHNKSQKYVLQISMLETLM